MSPARGLLTGQASTRPPKTLTTPGTRAPGGRCGPTASPPARFPGLLHPLPGLPRRGNSVASPPQHHSRCSYGHDGGEAGGHAGEDHGGERGTRGHGVYGGRAVSARLRGIARETERIVASGGYRAPADGREVRLAAAVEAAQDGTRMWGPEPPRIPAHVPVPVRSALSRLRAPARLRSRFRHRPSGRWGPGSRSPGRAAWRPPAGSRERGRARTPFPRC